MTIYMQVGERFYVPSLDQEIWIHEPDYQERLIPAVGVDIVGFGQGKGVEVQVNDGKNNYVVTPDPDVVRKAVAKAKGKVVVTMKQV
jgi:hypothetical protein